LVHGELTKRTKQLRTTKYTKEIKPFLFVYFVVWPSFSNRGSLQVHQGRAVVSGARASHNGVFRHSTHCRALVHAKTGSMPKRSSRMTVPEFVALKAAGRKIAMLTAYDYPTAALLDGAGIDAILVGDSMSMVVQGHETTLPVTLDEMIYHAEMVGRAVERALVIVDLPFPTNHLGVHKAIESAGRILKETRCQAVKLEGGADQTENIAGLVAAGIPVMAHVGLRPQSVHQMGGYRIQRDAERLRADAQSAQEAGAFAVVLECIPTGIAAEITAALKIPTIGIGAGAHCDGQVLVTHDLVGLTFGYIPKFVKQYADMKGIVSDVATRYREDVQSGRFPGPEQEFRS
jgi:3-methyl-2-oxobutanoate hydroxymethyltransferase